MSSLFDQYVGTGAATQTGSGQTSPGWTRYEGSIPQGNGPITPQKSTVPFWDTPPLSLDPSEENFSPWDTISFGGQPFPGMARVKSKKSKRVDVKLSKGQSGATYTFVGWKPAEVEVTLTVWTQDQLNQLQNLLPTILPKPGTLGTNTPVDIYYPSLALIGIRSVLIFDVEALEPGNPKGSWSMKVKAQEWYPPPKKDETSTAKGSGTYTGNAAIKTGTQNQAETLLPPSVTDAGTRIGFFKK